MPAQMTACLLAACALLSAAADFVPPTRDGRGIQAAIDAAAAAGGGRVVLEPATYQSGTLYLRSNVELHLPEGATILGHDKPDGYDDVDDTRIGKLPEKSKKVFIAAFDATNVSITGHGVIDGQGPAFYDRNVPPWSAFYAKPPHPRPRMVEMYKCRNVRFEGVLFRDSPGWTFWLRNCEDVLANGIRVHGDQRMINNDGLHLDGCKRMRIIGCDFKTGDDSIVFRAIEPPDHNAYDALGEDLFVADCTIDSACSGVRLGCPSDNIIRGAVFTNCVFRGRSAVQSSHPVRYIRPGTGFPKGNCSMEDILFVDCAVDVRGSPVRFYAEEGVCLRKFGNVTFRRMRLRGGAAIELAGNADSVVENVRFEDVSGEIADKTPVVMQYARGVAFDGFNVSCVPPRQDKVDNRVKVGLYCDMGSRGDNVVKWTRLLGESRDVALTLLDGQDLRDGRLSGLDLLVMPGGSGFDQYESMGEAGARAIRDYVRGGGRYLGTCAGMALLLNETNRVALLPLRRIDGHFRRGGGDLGVEFSEAGAKALGLDRRIWAVRYHNGPIVVPADVLEGTKCETLATCRNGIHEQGISPRRDDMVGTPAFVRATCGKGEIIACNCHPEASPGTRELVVAMIKALTGREIHPPAKYFRRYQAFGKGPLMDAVRYNE